MSALVTGPLEPFVRGCGFEYWNRYAAVNDEFIPFHMDDKAAQDAGYPTAFGMGNLTWSYVHLALHKWFGDAATIRQVNASFRNAVIRGTMIHVEGEITSASEADGKIVYEVAVTVKNQDGQEIAPAKAIVVA